MPTERPITPADVETLRRAIAVSGMSDRQFAVRVLVRDERTIRRWLALERPIPAVVVERCTEIIRLATQPPSSSE